MHELLERIGSSELKQWQVLFEREDAELARQRKELERKR